MISIIIPTHNRRSLLQEAIESIAKQNDVDFELIIVDDASSDNTVSYLNSIEGLKIKIIHNESNLFAHGSRKKGYSCVTGDYVIFMDDDDFYIDEHFFKNAEKILDENSNVSVVIGSTVAFIDNVYGKVADLGGEGIIGQYEYINGFCNRYKKPSSTLTAVFRRQALDNIGVKDFRMVNDTCIYLMGIIEGDVYLINKPVAAYRMHGGNISNSRFKIRFIKDCLEAKRELYEIANSRNLINNPKEWFSEQISQSAFYFIVSSGKNVGITLYSLLWVLFRGKGTQLNVIRKAISSLR